MRVPTRRLAAAAVILVVVGGCQHRIPLPAGASFRDAPYAPEMIVIPAGHFTMGSTEAETEREHRRPESAVWERPQHDVVVHAPLAVSVGHVTRAEFAAFVEATGRDMQGCMVRDGVWQFEPTRSFRDTAARQTDSDPAVCVSPADAEDYTHWLSTRTGHRYRLLHEAEWEYAARAGTNTARWWGDASESICAHANGADRAYDAAYPGEAGVNMACSDGFVQSNPWDAFPPNAFGLRNMLGDVWQWTADCFVAGYAQAPTDAGAMVSGGDCEHRVIRGGSWHNPPDALRSAARFWLPVTMRSSSVGFRVARELMP